MDSVKNCGVQAITVFSLFVIASLPSYQLVLFPILALASLFFTVSQQAWEIPVKHYNQQQIVRVVIVGMLQVLHLGLLIVLAQVYDPVLPVLALPNYIFIIQLVSIARDGRWQTYQAAGLGLWSILLLIQTIVFGPGGALLGLIQSLTNNVAENLIRSFGDQVEDMKLQSYTTMVSAFAALLLSVLQIWFQVFTSTEGIARSPSELIGLYAIFAAALCVFRMKPESIQLRMVTASLACILLKFVLAQPAAPAICMFLILLPAICLVHFNENTSELPLGANKEATITLISHIMEHSDSRRITMFLVINLAFMFVEAIYGYWNNSLGLISDAAHMCFDCTALFIGLYASYMAKFTSDKLYTYGYGRYEVLSGFVNGIFLIFVAFSVLAESLERILEPPEVTTDNLLLVSVLGLLVNLVGLYWFHGDMGGENMQGVFLHVLADTLGSVGVIISSILVEWFGWYITDPLCSLMISVLIFLSVFPLIHESGKCLT